MKLTAHDTPIIEVKKVWSYTSTPHVPSWRVAWLSIGTLHLHLFGHTYAAVTVYRSAYRTVRSVVTICTNYFTLKP